MRADPGREERGHYALRSAVHNERIDLDKVSTEQTNDSYFQCILWKTSSEKVLGVFLVRMILTVLVMVSSFVFRERK